MPSILVFGNREDQSFEFRLVYTDFQFPQGNTVRLSQNKNTIKTACKDNGSSADEKALAMQAWGCVFRFTDLCQKAGVAMFRAVTPALSGPRIVGTCRLPAQLQLQ